MLLSWGFSDRGRSMNALNSYCRSGTWRQHQKWSLKMTRQTSLELDLKMFVVSSQPNIHFLTRHQKNQTFCMKQNLLNASLLHCRRLLHLNFTWCSYIPVIGEVWPITASLTLWHEVLNQSLAHKYSILILYFLLFWTDDQRSPNTWKSL